MDDRTQLIERRQNKHYRDAFVSEHINSGVAFQILHNRKARNLSQVQLGQLCDMKQNQISRLENPDAGTPNLKTLDRIASAFDCALIVRFVPFSELVSWRMRLDRDNLIAASFKDDDGLKSQIVTRQATPIYNFSLSPQIAPALGTTYFYFEPPQQRQQIEPTYPKIPPSLVFDEPKKFPQIFISHNAKEAKVLNSNEC
jgi:transcriptional regulator with XRE-family HTH domain